MALVLFSGGGAGDFELGVPLHDWPQVRATVARLLASRGEADVASLLAEIPFVLYQGSNHFNDEFFVLHGSLPPEDYARWERETRGTLRQRASVLANAVTDLNYYCRFVALDVDIGDSIGMVEAAPINTKSEAVRVALADAEVLLAASGPASAIDRLHTAFHGYLREVANDVGIETRPDAEITAIFGLLRSSHPAFGMVDQSRIHVLRGLAQVIDALSPIRNTDSLAHPTNSLPPNADAELFVNSVRTMFRWLESLVRSGT
jgi:hypothetical protein